MISYSRIKAAPECYQHNRGLTQTDSHDQKGLPHMVGSLADSGDRTPSADELIGMLDQLRHEYESIRQRRADAAQYARDHGLSFHHIAVALGMTEGGARHLASRSTAA